MPDQKRELTFFGKVFRILLPVLLILGGCAAWSYFQSTAPVMQRVQPKRQATIVETETIQQISIRPMISAMGTVAAARQVAIKAQVSGIVQSVSEGFIPGSIVRKGETLLTIDPADYRVAVKKAEAAVADAKASLALEQGSQNVAREEVRLLAELSDRDVTETDLALRKPQLAQARAALDSAEADLSQARLDLSRTKISAPFNAMIIDRSVDLGAYAGAQQALVTLVGTDAFWIEAVVSQDLLGYIDFNYPGGCPVTISSQSGEGTWQGRVIQVSGKINDTSRMATLIVSVLNPLGTRNHRAEYPLMIDDYVHVEITGKMLDNVMVLPRSVLQDNDVVWVNHNDSLDIRTVSLVWKGPDTVYIREGLNPGDEVVTSALSTPVQGMPLKILDVNASDTKISDKSEKGSIRHEK